MELIRDLSLAKIHSLVPYPVRLSEDANASTINESKGDAVLDAKNKLGCTDAGKTFNSKTSSPLSTCHYSVIQYNYQSG
jgi:hypothetical protein